MSTGEHNFSTEAAQSGGRRQKRGAQKGRERDIGVGEL